MQAISSLFDYTGDGVFVLNKDQEIISWNAAAAQMLGYDPKAVIGQKCWEVLQGETPEGQSYCRLNCPLYSRLYDHKVIGSFDLLVKHLNGRRVLINISTIPLSEQKITKAPVTLAHLWRVQELPRLPRRRLRIHLLGPTHVVRPDGTVVKGPLWNRIKVRALLAYLTIQEGQPVSRERIIEVLWPDTPYKSALQNLNTTIYGLRRSLEPDLDKVSDSKYIIYDGGQYFLADVEQHWLDIRAYEGGIRQARTETEPENKITAYQSVIALYRGDFLADLEGTRVLSLGEQERYRLLFLAAMDECAMAYESLGQLQEAEDVYERILSTDPCREITAQRLIKLLLRQGRRADALIQCQHLATALEEELDMMLSAETRELMNRICHEL